MSILIKGMKLPKECRDCPMDIFYINCGDTRCKLTNKLLAKDYNVIPFSGRPDWCPLVEVSAPHGRLIDEDNVIDAIHERLQTLRTHKEFIKKHGDIDLLGVMPYIAKIPTVIEAEECEDE